MTNKIKYFKRLRSAVIMCVALGVSVSACTDHYNELNTPPDELTTDQVGTNLLGNAFANTQYHGMFGPGFYFQTGENLYASMFAQYFALAEISFDYDQYLLTRRTERTWDYLYGSVLPTLQFVEQSSEENDLALENAVAKVWKVQMFHRITDYWGPIIYSEYGSGETSVKYDSQESIYKDFFKVLDEAVTVLDQYSGDLVFPSSDLVYEGNAHQWLVFANSLRLRLAMRISYVEPELAQQEAEKAINAPGGVMMDNSDNAEVLTTDENRNPYGQITQWGEFRASAAMVSALTGYEDPRTSEYLNEAVDGGGYHGIRNGLPKDNKGSFLESIVSDMDTKWHSVESGGSNPPLRVMNAAEVYFLRAEGALRGWSMGGTAQDLYEEGIRTSLEEVTDATAQEIDDYINSTNTPAAIDSPAATQGEWDTPPVFDIPVQYQASADFETRLEQIISQKWLSNYPDGWEAWAERRRTHYPTLYPIIESLNPDIPEDDFPKRLPYSPGEYSDNTAAVEEAVNTLLNGPDNGITKLWWDAKP
ncbi:MAG: SusD/RagB family nutrient-binding outer membrane lipoprotein [Balneolaceae bacterium]